MRRPMQCPEIGREMKVTGEKTSRPGVLRVESGRYRIRCEYKDPKTGKRREVDRIVRAGSAEQAAQILSTLRNEHAEGIERRERVRLADYAISWLDGKKKAGRKRSTLERYAGVIDLHITPKLGDHYVDAIRPADVRAWWNAQEGEPSSCNGRLRVLRTLLEDARKDLELDAGNAAENIETMPEGREEDDHRVIDAADLTTFLEAVRAAAPQWYALTVALTLTGARFGEVSALRWDDIDDAARVIHIRRAHYRGTLGTPKTGKSRKVPLLPELRDVLQSHRRALIAAQAPGLSEGLVFPTAVGTLPTPGALTKPFRKALKLIAEHHEREGTRSPFADRTPSPHWLRHTLNDLLRRTAAGEVQRAIIGHSTQRMSEHYSHVALDERRDALERAMSFLRPRKESGEIAGEPEIQKVKTR